MDYFIVRDPDSYGDVATIWNYRKGDWCWDLDGDYSAADGFAYLHRDTAELRVKRGHRFKDATNVRVVSRSELDRIRSDRRYD